MDILDSCVVDLVYDLGLAAKGLGVRGYGGDSRTAASIAKPEFGDLAGCGEG